MRKPLSLGLLYLTMAGSVSVPIALSRGGIAIASAEQQCAGPPNAPAGLIASVTGALVTLTWRSSDGCSGTSFVVHAGTAPGLSNVAVVSVGTSFTLSASAPAGTYYVRVVAQNSAGSSAPSPEVVVTVGGGGPGIPVPAPCTAPPVPPQLNSLVFESTVRFTFLSLATMTPDQTYVLEAGSAPGASNLAVIDVGRTLLFSTSLPPPGTYYVRARSRDACGTGAASNEVTLTVGAAPPPPTTPTPPTGPVPPFEPPPPPGACGPEVPRQGACGAVVALCEQPFSGGFPTAAYLYDGRLACGALRNPCFATSSSQVSCYVCPGPFCPYLR